MALNDLTVRYGEAVAVNGVSFTVDRGQVVALLGANGAGKSSLLDAISGFVPTEGSVSVGGVPLLSLPAEDRAAYVAHVPEGRKLFPKHTARENLLVAAFEVPRQERLRRLEGVLEVLPRLNQLLDRRCDLLSGGEQQMVALGRGLMSEAPVLMIDELSLGLAPTVAQQFGDTLRALRDQGYGILLVEQYVTLALDVADRVIVLSHGDVVLDGDTDELRDQVVALEEAYLGGDVRAGETVADRVVTNGAVATPVAPSRSEAVLQGLVGILAFVAALFAPWYSIVGVTGSVSNLAAFSMPAPGPWVSVVGAALSALMIVIRFWLRGPLSVPQAAAAPVVGALMFGPVLARCWMFGTGLPGGAAATYQRTWGLFLALTGAALVLMAGVQLFVEAWKWRPESQNAAAAGTYPRTTDR